MQIEVENHEIPIWSLLNHTITNIN